MALAACNGGGCGRIERRVGGVRKISEGLNKKGFGLSEAGVAVGAAVGGAEDRGQRST